MSMQRVRMLVWLMLMGSLASAAFAQTGTLEFTLNGRAVSLPPSTPVLIDEQATTLAALRDYPNGMHAEWSTPGMRAVAGGATPVFSYSLIGPVTGNAPLQVLGQPITVTGDSTLAGVSLPVDLPLNTPIVVAGLVDANGSVLATLVERRAAFGNTFLLTGPVQAVDAGMTQLRVGAQWISYQGVVFNGCAAALPVVGEYLSLRAQAQPNFVPGTVLGNVVRGNCVQLVPAGMPGAQGFLGGLVTAVPNATEFNLGALSVTVSAATAYLFGAADDLAPGVAVSVDGAYVTESTFAAGVVEFIQPVVRFRAPMTPAEVTPGQSLRPFGVLVRGTAQVRDEDQILANGLTQPRQVEVRGYLDRLGRAYATRVRERGAPNANAAQLRGPVQSIARPLLIIQGLTVDTTGATFVDEWGGPLTADGFFAALQVDHVVDASGAAWTAATRTLAGGAITFIGAEPLRPAAAPAASARVNAGTASAYSNLTPLFVDGFEG